MTRHIAISGELGSGKSSVARVLADQLGYRYLSTGAIQRSIAESLSLSTLDANRLAEKDESIDVRIDGTLIELGGQDEPIVFDSRMAWHFVPNALKVHLVVDPAVGAARALSRGPTAAEHYESLEVAARDIEQRFLSERTRFLAKYDVDIARLRNYDLVIDTADASVDEVAAVVLAVLEGPAAGRLRLFVSPNRLHGGTSDTSPLPQVAYARPVFTLVGPGPADQAASLVEVELIAEGEEAAGILEGHRNPGGST